MAWPVVLFLGLQAAVFVLWIWLAARGVTGLFLHVRNRAAADGAMFWPSPSAVLGGAASWARDPGTAPERRNLLTLTVVLLGLSMVSALA